MHYIYSILPKCIIDIITDYADLEHVKLAQLYNRSSNIKKYKVEGLRNDYFEQFVDMLYFKNVRIVNKNHINPYIIVPKRELIYNDKFEKDLKKNFGNIKIKIRNLIPDYRYEYNMCTIYCSLRSRYRNNKGTIIISTLPESFVATEIGIIPYVNHLERDEDILLSVKYLIIYLKI